MAFVCMGVHGSDCNPPEWMNSPPMAGADCYWIGQGTGTTSESASNAAWAHVLGQLAISRSTRITSEITGIESEKDEKTSSFVESKVHADGFFYNNGQRLFKVMDARQISPGCIDNLYHHYLLLCVPQDGCSCSMSIPSNTGAMFRSCLLPGWGQIYKGKGVRGIFFAVSTVALVASSIVFNSSSSQSAESARYARTISARNDYLANRDNYWSISLGCAAGAIGLYLWNIYDSKNCRVEVIYK